MSLCTRSSCTNLGEHWPAFSAQSLRKRRLRPSLAFWKPYHHARGPTCFPFSFLCIPARTFTYFLIRGANIYRWETVWGALISSDQCLNMCVDHLITRSGMYKQPHIIPLPHLGPQNSIQVWEFKSLILCNQVLVEHDCWIILNWRHMSGGWAICIISGWCPLGLIHRGYLQLLPHSMHSSYISICKIVNHI